MDGILVIDKPVGPTSHDVVDVVRRILRQQKVGHTGTLDPVATGVLPLVVGQATKIARYLTGGDKTYVATFRLGQSTDTLDAEGTVLAEHPVTTDEPTLRQVLASFVGTIEQIPPMYSAKKVDGKRLYELARQGVEVEREAKKVTLHSIEVESVALPDVTVTVRCSAGTYVRVLAHDLGERLGCGAHLQKLRRVAAGPFTIDDAVALDRLEQEPALAKDRLLPLARGLSDAPRIALPRHLAKAVASGHQLSAGDLKNVDVPSYAFDQVVVLWHDSGELLAVTRALFPSAELPASRHDRRALKTERVLGRG
jgi:tRNA pseudouridine55 synthase